MVTTLNPPLLKGYQGGLDSSQNPPLHFFKKKGIFLINVTPRRENGDRKVIPFYIFLHTEFLYRAYL
jgi:hypothetical protein